MKTLAVRPGESIIGLPGKFLLLVILLQDISNGQDLKLTHDNSAPFGEHVFWGRTDTGIRVLIDSLPRTADRRRQLVIYATPNGNSLEQTLGCAPVPRRDWQFEIQHVAAQVRKLREIDKDRDVVLVVVQAPQLSWPLFRANQPNAPQLIHDLVHALAQQTGATSVTLTGHSGGGSFLLNYLNASARISEQVERIVFLDANYSFAEEAGHGEKLKDWITGDPERRLVVVAYDDREIALDGKKVIGPDGGTFRATERMKDCFRKSFVLGDRRQGPFQVTASERDQILLAVHPNPENRILHTALVGEMNGLLFGLTMATDHEGRWGSFGGPRAYEDWVQPHPFNEPSRHVTKLLGKSSKPLSLPLRSETAATASQLVAALDLLSVADREAVVAQEILAGNIPDFVRQFCDVEVELRDVDQVKHVGIYSVMADYFAIGGNNNFLRIPLTPGAACIIADQTQCSLITRKVSDDLVTVAELALNPQPMTVDREQLTTFVKHQRLIEEQMGAQRRGLVVGIKKDVVWTNRLLEKTHRVGIYGWHYPHGQPIQPLYVGHFDQYVDYSHGIRLIAKTMQVDGVEKSVEEVLGDPILHPLLSDEGPMNLAKLKRHSAW